MICTLTPDALTGGGVCEMGVDVIVDVVEVVAVV